MSHFNEALVDAINGGYEWGKRRDLMAGVSAIQALALLDPDFWKCLGKTRGWELKYFKCGVSCGNMIPAGDWKANMHGLIDALAQGETIESYLSSIETK